MAKKIELSVIIPAFNESKTIGAVLRELNQTLPKKGCEVIVVDDASSDNTSSVSKSNGAVVLRNAGNLGYGASIKKGLQRAVGEWVLILDADGTYPVKDFQKLWAVHGKYDMVVGARVGKETHVPLARKPAKWFLTQLADYLTESDIQDLNSGFRLFKKDLAMQYWSLYPNGFSFTTTLTVASLTDKKEVGYVPINYYKRKSGSTVSPARDFIGFNQLLLKLALFFKPLKIFVPASLLFLLVAVALVMQNVMQFNRVVDDIKILLLAVTGIQLFFFGLLAELIVRKTKPFWA